MWGRTSTVMVLALVAVLLVGCVPGPNTQAGAADGQDGPAGFWSGLWHGFIVAFTFVASLFSDDVGLYEARNNGAWYDFGFVLGVMVFFGGGGGGASTSSRRR